MSHLVTMNFCLRFIALYFCLFLRSNVHEASVVSAARLLLSSGSSIENDNSSPSDGDADSGVFKSVGEWLHKKCGESGKQKAICSTIGSALGLGIITTIIIAIVRKKKANQRKIEAAGGSPSEKKIQDLKSEQDVSKAIEEIGLNEEELLDEAAEGYYLLLENRGVSDLQETSMVQQKNDAKASRLNKNFREKNRGMSNSDSLQISEMNKKLLEKLDGEEQLDTYKKVSQSPEKIKLETLEPQEGSFVNVDPPTDMNVSQVQLSQSPQEYSNTNRLEGRESSFATPTGEVSK